MASDIEECSKIAKRVAIKITESLFVGGIITRGARVETNTVDMGYEPLVGKFLSR